MVLCASGKARQARRQDTKTNPHNVKSGGERGEGAHGCRPQSVLRTEKEQAAATKAVHDFVLQPSFFKVAVPH